MSEEGNLNDYSGTELVVTSVAFIILNCFFVLLRFHVRVKSKAKFGLDDYFLLPALFANILLDISCLCEQNQAIQPSPKLTRRVIVYVGGVGRHDQF